MGMIRSMAKPDQRTDGPSEPGPWNPGIQSQMPRELMHLATIFRPVNVFTSIAAVAELQGLTGFAPSELVAFRPQRLALHELLIRVTADFAVPDGSRIGDLGINFREMASLMLERYLVPEMDSIITVYEGARRELRGAVQSGLAEVVPEQAPVAARAAEASRASRLLGRLALRRRASALPGREAAAAAADLGWGPRHLADCERRANLAGSPQQMIAYRTLARVMSALFATQGHAWGTRDLIVSMATDMACNDYGSECIGRAIEPLLLRAARNEGYSLLPRKKKLAGDIGWRWIALSL